MITDAVVPNTKPENLPKEPLKWIYLCIFNNAMAIYDWTGP